MDATVNNVETFIKGKVLVTIFHNAENLYTIAKVRALECNEELDEKEIVVTGFLPPVQEEDVYTFFGTFKEHAKYGKQFNVERFQKEMPQTKDGIIAYLSSDLFSGIGKRTAARIVDKLGDAAIQKIMADYQCLLKVPGFKEEKAQKLQQQLLEHQGLETVMTFLSQFNLGPSLSIKIYSAYRETAVEVIKNNPYDIISKVEGIGFVRADKIGEALGFSVHHPMRIQAALLYSIEQYCLQEGYSYVTRSQVVDTATKILYSRSNDTGEMIDISREIEQLVVDKKIIIEDDRYYIPSLYYAEKGIATHLYRLLNEREPEEIDQAQFHLLLGELEDTNNIEYAPQQRDAIKEAIEEPFCIITGGPGTGKTTVVNAIVEMYAKWHDINLDKHAYKNEKDFPILLAAPTGRAAKRITESTGLPASTIHRLLGYTANGTFTHNEEEPLKGEVIIIDEFSMVDVWLAHQLMKAIPKGMKIIIVGDKDQLPSVGPGQILKDLLDSKTFPVIELQKIYRQGQESTIISLAHDMKIGAIPANISQNQKDRSFIKCHAGQIVDVVKQVSQNALSKGFHVRDIQVLAPMYKGPAGITALNKALQEVFNPKGERTREMQYGEFFYRKGDKVIQLVNQPESGVFNGDIGEIEAIFFAKENTEKQDMIVINFDGREVTYTRNDFSQFMHAYCCSIHKSQGSEYGIVIIPVVHGYSRMLRRNLLYTAVTRSKSFLILCGEESAFRYGVERVEGIIRQTTLVKRVQAYFSNVEESSANINDMSEEDYLEYMWRTSLPYEEKLTPYDFLADGEH